MALLTKWQVEVFFFFK